MAREYRRGTWRAETEDGRPIPYAQATVWDAQEDGHQVVDLRQLDGITLIPGGILTCDSWGYLDLPGFVDPAETPHLYIIGSPDGIIPGVGRVHLVPSDMSPRITSVETQQAGTAAALAALEDSRAMPGGLATLDEDGRVPSEQLPPSTGGGMAGVLDITAYDADPTGATDATPAIQAALNDARDQGGGVVWVPGGVYSIRSGPLRIYRRTHLWLAPDATIRRDAVGTMLLNGDQGQQFGGYSGHGDITISGGTWDANGVAIGQHNMVLSIGHARNVTIRDTTILDVPGFHAIEVNSTETCRISNVVCAGFVDSVGDRGFSEAIQIDGAYRQSVFGGFGPYDHTPTRNVLITGCTVTNSSRAGSGPWGRGIGSHSAAPDQPHSDIRVIGNHIEATREWAIGGYTWRDAIITGNTIRSCGGGIWVRSLDSSKAADRVRLNGTSIPGSQPLNGIVITNNVLNSIGPYAAAIQVEGEDTGPVSEVVLGDNMVDGTTGATGLRIISVENYSIARNVLNGIGSTAISQLSTRSGLIADNAISNPSSSGISVDSRQLAAGLLADVVVHRNVVRNPGNNGVHILGGSEIEISDNRLTGFTGTGYGIQISSNASYVTAHGNRIRGTGAAGLNVTTTTSYAKVYSNDARGSTIVVPAGITGRDITADNIPTVTG